MTERRAPGESEIRAWCVDRLAGLLDMPAERIDPADTFARLGLDSATAVYFVIEIEEWLGVELTPDIVFHHPTIDALAAFLVGGGSAPQD